MKVKVRGNTIISLHEACSTPLPPLRRKELLISHFFTRSKKIIPKDAPRTRNDHLPVFTLSRPNTEFYKKSPFYRGAREWNKLPSHLQTCTDKPTFKLQLKKHLGTYLKKPKPRKKKKKKGKQTA